MSPSLPKTLFVGFRDTGLTWYRCAVPATGIGCDWVGVDYGADGPTVLTGTLPAGPLDVSGYEVVVVELAAGPRWLQTIRDWQARGITVLYEIDDWLRGVRRQEGHVFASSFSVDAVRRYEECMAAADGVICSTQWLADRYRGINPRTWVCRNALDLRRYAYTVPERPTVNVGWAGGSGHLEAARPWMPVVAAIMEARPFVKFVSIGEPFAHAFANKLGAERALHIPFQPMDVYAAALTHFDIALAPAGRGGFHLGKSDLRWLEASALKLPTIADPVTYPEVEHGVTGFHAETQDEVAESLLKLVDDAALRRRVGEAAYEHVRRHRSLDPGSQAWIPVLREAAGLAHSSPAAVA